MILTSADAEQFFPNLDIPVGEEWLVLRQAQAIAEGPAGANRPLEVEPFTEHPIVDGRGTVQLSRVPVLNDPPIVVQVRWSGGIAPYGISTNQTNWIDLEEDKDYRVDYERGEVELITIGSAMFVGMGQRYHSTYGNRRSRPGAKVTPAEMKITYSTGYDFAANPLSHAAETIKAAVAGILKIQRSPQATGLKSFDMDDFYKVDFAAGLAAEAASAAAGSPFEDYLKVLRQYRPRGGV
ncbi:MAG: hypothetical protein AAFY20_09355 [Cyanobacteria bacterium J06639_14]